MTTPPATAVRGALLRYRVMAYVVGVMLLLLVGAMLLKYVFGVIESTTIVAIGHGWLYMIYLLASVDLWFRTDKRLPFLNMIGVALAGTIPFMSFVAERWVHREVTALAPVGDGSATWVAKG